MTQGPGTRSHSARARVIALAMTAAFALAGSAAWGAVPTKVTHPHAAKLRHGVAAVETSAAEKASARRAGAKARTKHAAAASRRRHVEPESSRQPMMKRASLERRAALPERRAAVLHRRAALPERAAGSSKAAAEKADSAGGELTAEDFFRAAGASPEAKGDVPAAAAVSAPVAAPAEKLERGESHPPEDNRVVLPPMAKAAPKSPVSAHIVVAAKAPQASILLLDDDAPEVSAAAAADPRMAVLTHPSHEEMAEDAVEPMVLPGLYRNGRLVVPAPLKGSREILVHQNLMADDEGLERVRDDSELNRLRAAHQLVNLPESASLRVNPELNGDRRCARVWTVKFAADMAREFYARFREPLQVNSAVRTVAYQVRLQRTNGNAAGVGGEAASPHLTGQAIDIGKRGMSMAEIAWMRAYLKPLMDAGKVDVEEEFQQACFHISVYKSYLPASRRGVVDVAQVRKPVVTEAR